MAETNLTTQTNEPRRNLFIEKLTTYRKKALHTHKLKSDFLIILDKLGGNLSAACEEIGVSFSLLNNRREHDQEFNDAIDHIKYNRSAMVLNDLEVISEAQALDPKHVVERIFQLKALNRAKYQPTNRQQTATQINIITAGVDIAEREGLVKAILGQTEKESNMRLDSDYSVSEVQEIQANPARVQEEDMV